MAGGVIRWYRGTGDQHTDGGNDAGDYERQEDERQGAFVSPGVATGGVRLASSKGCDE